jgi:hypothetical protein
MRISEVTITDLKNYAHVYHAEDDGLFSTILSACKSYIRGYTGLSDLQMDEKEDLVVALFVLSNEMYDNRVFMVEGSNVNAVVQNILHMYSVNLL